MSTVSQKNVVIEIRRQEAKRRRRFLALLGCMVVIATAVALMVPALSMTRGALVCEIPEHQHSDACYEQVLNCGLEEGEGHQHSDACYERQLVCELVEHAHSDACYEAPSAVSDDGANQKTESSEETLSDDSATQAVAGRGDGATSMAIGAMADVDAVNESNDLAGEGAENVEMAIGMPAQVFEASLKDADGNVVTVVKVTAPEGAFPASTSMKIDGVLYEDVRESVEAALLKELGGEEAPAIKRADAVDVTFFGADGLQIQPAKKVEIKISSSAILDMGNPLVIHVDEVDGMVKTADGTVTSADGKSFREAKDKYKSAELMKKTQLVNELEGDESTGNENSLKFDSDATGPYVIVELEGEGAGVEADAEDAEVNEGPGLESDAGVIMSESAMPAQSFEQELDGDDGSTVLTVLVEAPEGALPAGSTMVAALVDDSEVIQAAKDGAFEGEKAAGERAKALAADITFHDAEGNPLEPATEVRVTMSAPFVAQQDEVAVVHVSDDLATEVVEGAELDTNAEAVAFDAASFSVYALVYTVDFHWRVDGKTYEFNLPGGGFVSFTKLMEVLGVARGANTEDSESDSEGETSEDETQRIAAATLSDVVVSDETKEFVSDVEKVEFSNPDLIWINKVDADCTVGALKETNKLSVEFSAELTEERIAEIDNQSVDAGDWALVSLKAFDTEERLVITMKDGDRFVVKVTDARIGNSLNGQSFTIQSLDNPPLAMTSTDPYNYNNKRFFRANEVTGGNDQIWMFEYDGRYDRTYRIKSVATGQYIRLDGNSDDGFTLTDNNNDEASLFWIDYDNNTDTYEFSTSSPSHNYSYPVYLNTLYDNNSPRYTMGNQSQRFRLQEAQAQEVAALTGDWLLFLDEDEDEIYVRVGETISLRPFDEWTWKEQAVQSDHWNFPGDTNAPTNWFIANNAGNESSPSSWTSTNGVFAFNRHIKSDDQLGVRYWSVQGQAKKVGDYVLTNTRNNHQVTVHVIPADDEYHKLTPFTGPVPVKVNLFDYDLGKRLDPTSNTNVETNIVNQSVNIGHSLHFLSSGNGNGGINRYTKDNNNPGIVASELDGDHYPVLASNGESLGYLFDKSQTSWTGGNYSDGMIAYPGVTGLFQQDQDGYYYFNSNSNYAYYDAASNSMLLYPHTYTQINKSSKLFNSKPIGFFPFHPYESANEDHLWVNQNQYLNHHVGMSMEIDFEIPKSRQTENEKPIVYEFSGDDDVWVFVDNELVLDIGGIHQPLKGMIDFTNGKVYVYNASGTVTETRTFDVGAHKLSMFYLERGGCDSNLSLKMNMPLILGAGDVELYKSDSTNHNGLPDAVFGIWEDASCSGEPYTVATSNGNGVVFKHLPVRVEGQEFYIREILAPEGYTLDDTIYKATAGVFDVDAGEYPFTIKALTQEGETDPGTHDVGGKALPEIVNNLAEPIDLSVRKVWQDAAGNESDPPTGASVKFVLKRTRTYVDEPAYTVRLRNDSSSRDDIYDTITAHEGDALTISYVHNADSSHPTANCRAGNGAGTIVSMTTNNTTSESRVTYVVNPAHASNSIIDILIPDWFAEWCDPNRHNVSGLRVPMFASVSKAAFEITTEDDGDFNSEAHSVTLPTNDEEWIDTFDDLPTQEVKNGVIYQYRYYIEEDEANSTIPNGYEAIYTDYTGTNPVNGSHSQETASTGTQTVINQKLLDIPVTKIWPDYEKDHGDTAYTWEVDLQLDFRDVPVDGQGQPTGWSEYQPGNENYQMKLTKDQPNSSFEGLPMYVFGDNGAKFRREYSVVEKGYKVWENGTLIASHVGNEYTPADKRYALWYEHDAGENSTDPDSYYISVYNMHENRDVKEDITIDINKSWKNTDGSAIQPEDSYKAKFKLRRNVLVEYRNHEDESLPKSEWVTVNLATDANPNHVKTLVVPPGTQMFIRGNLKEGASPSNIKFTRSDTTEQLTAVADTDFHEYGYDLFKVEFTAPETHGAEITVTMNEYSELNVVGGASGFILSDSSDRQYFGTDETFSKEFELSNEKGWSKHFPDTTGSDSEIDDLLPVLEVSELDSEGKTANTYIYTYYFEEVECEPADFYASFTDSAGNALGDANHQIYTSTTIDATNRLKPGSLRIKKNVKINNEDVEASDPNIQFVDGAYSFRVEGVPGTSTENIAPRTVTVTISNGQSNTIEVEGLAPGKYKVVELTPPNGSSLVGQNGIIVDVEQNVTGADAPLVEMTNNRELTELEVKKEWSATSSADHPTEVTFKVYRTGYFMDGEVQRPASEGYYPDNDTVYTISGSDVTSVPNLPVHGMESIAGISRFVTYDYRVVEIPIASDIDYWPSYSVNGNEITITNTPVEKPGHDTNVSVSKSWLDKTGHDAASAHENDEIEFTLKATQRNTGYVPVHLVYINADNTKWKQQEVFVKKGEKLNFEFRKGRTVFSHRIEITEGDRQTATGGLTAQYAYESNAINDETTITLRQTFSYQGLLSTYYDKWGDTVEDLGFSYQWTSAVTATDGVLYTDYTSFYNAMREGSGGESNDLIYELSKNAITGSQGAYEGQITSDWAAIFESLPEFQRIGDDYVVLTYEISELKIKPSGLDEEPVGPTTFENYKGESTNYLVNWEQNGNSWTITNREKPGLDIIVKKTDTSATGHPIAGAIFEISKQDGSVFAKLTHDSYEWLDVNDQFTVPEEGLMLTGLKDGKYQITEVKSPDGYVISNSTPATFEIEHGAVVDGSDELSDGVIHIPASGSDKDIYVVPNMPGAELPHTGGPGTGAFAIIGLVLICLAGVVFARKLRLE